MERLLRRLKKEPKPNRWKELEDQVGHRLKFSHSDGEFQEALELWQENFQKLVAAAPELIKLGCRFDTSGHRLNMKYDDFIDTWTLSFDPDSFSRVKDVLDKHNIHILGGYNNFSMMMDIVRTLQLQGIDPHKHDLSFMTRGKDTLRIDVGQGLAVPGQYELTKALAELFEKK